MAEGSSEQDCLAHVVKEVHAKLRKEFKSGATDPDEQWLAHTADSQTLANYSRAMHALAKGPWASKQGECDDRIRWCVDKCDEYFTLPGVLERLLLKDLRRLGHGMPTIVPLDHLPSSKEDVDGLVREYGSRKWLLLDVGSCYNPFVVFPQFEVTGMDIAPATEGVLRCDFLTVPPSPSGPIRSEHYDVVVFSLLLSYFPSPQQRLKCCVNAHSALRLHGLLLIVTPDSSHQNRHAGLMKCWRVTIEALGFHRWCYEKNTHLHCMAFRKCSVSVGVVCEDGLAIPQDREERGTADSAVSGDQQFH